ncbi:hypothetical protein N8T08_007890 [Aspergillus melleus]|uniref:Uncharacterized protein n=1 Tax=Aspergillus melleus TaxID=138277 RepID=A0ACC3AWS4_9EURO|nr:hypothetical protein N8T08_007890 [Aspergillus melleus]
MGLLAIGAPGLPLSNTPGTLDASVQRSGDNVPQVHNDLSHEHISGNRRPGKNAEADQGYEAWRSAVPQAKMRIRATMAVSAAQEALMPLALL